MDIQEILSKIQKEAVTVIHEEVRVQFDNAQQTPLGFQWRGRPVIRGNAQNILIF